MTRNFWFGLVFFIFTFLVACWRLWAWIIWKILNLNKHKQVFNLLAKNRFLEITGASGKGKSWLLCHLFLNFKGAVKFTNMPTPQGIYTLTKENCENHCLGKWPATNRFYYFFDDIIKFEEWGKTKMTPGFYQEWQKYCAESGKLGASFVWTNNGLNLPSPSPFADNRNQKLKVRYFFSFMGYSLLWCSMGWKSYLIPIDHKEIEAFYDPRWNVNKKWNDNVIKEIADRLGAKELTHILESIEHKHDIKEESYDRAVLENYIRMRKKEEKDYQAKKAYRTDKEKAIEKYGLNDQPLDKERVEQFNKNEKKQKEQKAEIKNKQRNQQNSQKVHKPKLDKNESEINEDIENDEELTKENDNNKITKEKT